MTKKVSCLFLSLFVLACSKHEYGQANLESFDVYEPAYVHSTNYSVLEKYYCTFSSWPKSIVVAKEFAKRRDLIEHFDYYSDPLLVNKVSVELLVDYLSQDQNKRTSVRFLAPECQPKDARAQNRVSLAGGRLTFKLPEDFSIADWQLVEKAFGLTGVPQYVYTNKQVSMIIGVRFTSQLVAKESLELLKPRLEKSIEVSDSGLGLDWRARDFVQINGEDWLRFDYDKNLFGFLKKKTRLYGSIEGSLFIFEFEYYGSVSEENQEVMEQVISSIVLK